MLKFDLDKAWPYLIKYWEEECNQKYRDKYLEELNKSADKFRKSLKGLKVIKE